MTFPNQDQPKEEGGGETPEQKIQRLEAVAAQTELLKQQLAAQQQQTAAVQQQYAQDMARTNAYVQEALQRMTPPQQVEEDEEAQKLRARVQEAVQAGLTPVMQGYHENNRAVQRETTRLKYGEDFEKFKDEIEGLLNMYPPNVAGAAGAYEAAYQAVRAKHIDEIIADRVKAQVAEGAGVAPGQTKRPSSPSPQRTAVGRAASPPSKEGGAYDNLGDDDRKFLEEIGLTQEDFNKYQSNDYTEDFLGFKGRKRV